MFSFTLDIYCTSVRPGRGIPHMWLSLRFLLSFYLLKGFFCSFSLLLLRVKDRGCHTLLKPDETNCGLWIWAIQIKFDWLIDWDKGVIVEGHFQWYESWTSRNVLPSGSEWDTQPVGPGVTGENKVYKDVEWHTSPSWYWASVWGGQFCSRPLKLSLLNSLVMADRDLPFVSGRNRPT